MKNKIGLLIAGSAVLGSLLFGGVAFAQTPGTSSWGRMPHAPGVFGTVSATNGSTLTVTSKGGPNGAAGTSYTVDAAGAVVTKNGAASTISSVAVGDTVVVQGTLSGTTVTATTIRDGMIGRGMSIKPGQHSSSTKLTSIIKGNGQPVIGGSVTAINGSTLTVTNKSSITYTVDATNATVEKGNATSSVSNIAMGDNVIVQGTVNGTSVTAASVVDSGSASANLATDTPNTHRGGMGGFFAGIGGFFQHLFGF